MSLPTLSAAKLRKVYFLLSVLSLFFISFAIYWSGEDNLPPLKLAVRYSTLALYANFLFAYIGFVNSRESESERPRRWLIFAFIGSVLCLMNPVFSGDLMEYLIRGRMLGLYHVSPYRATPLNFPDDLLRPYSIWIHNPDSYGPLSVYIQTLPAVLFPKAITGMVWSYKMIVLLFYGISTLYFWKILERLRWPDAGRFWALFAYCPLLVVSAFIDGHNDVIMMAFAMISLYYFLARRYGWAFFFWTCAFLIKYMVIIHLPFLVLFAVRDKWREEGGFPGRFVVKQAVVNLSIMLLAFLPVWHGINTFLAILRQKDAFYTNTIPYMIHQAITLVGIPAGTLFVKWALIGGYLLVYAIMLFRSGKLETLESPTFFRMVALAYLLFFVVLHSPMGYWYLVWPLFWMVLARWPRPVALISIYSLLGMLAFYKRINYLTLIALAVYVVLLAEAFLRRMAGRCLAQRTVLK